MAKINGVEIKNLKGFIDHDGLEIFQGTIVIDGVEQGHWSMDYMGGPDHFKFDTTELQKRTKQYSKGLPKGLSDPDIFEDVDILISQVLELQACENEYMKFHSIPVIITKNGCMEYGVTGFNEKAYNLLLKKYGSPERLFIPHGPEDFQLTVDAEHPAARFWFDKILFKDYI